MGNKERGKNKTAGAHGHFVTNVRVRLAARRLMCKLSDYSFCGGRAMVTTAPIKASLPSYTPNSGTMEIGV